MINYNNNSFIRLNLKKLTSTRFINTNLRGNINVNRGVCIFILDQYRNLIYIKYLKQTSLVQLEV